MALCIDQYLCIQYLNTITYLTESEVTNENGILVENAAIFPDVPFFVAIEEIFIILSQSRKCIRIDEYIYNEEHPLSLAYLHRR